VLTASSVVSVRVPSWAKRVLEERGVEYQRLVREILVSLAEAASGEAEKRMREAFLMADAAAGDAEMTVEEIVEAVRGCDRRHGSR
jgi:cell division septum initiation protein DivIVA